MATTITIKSLSERLGALGLFLYYCWGSGTVRGSGILYSWS